MLHWPQHSHQDGDPWFKWHKSWSIRWLRVLVSEVGSVTSPPLAPFVQLDPQNETLFGNRVFKDGMS